MCNRIFYGAFGLLLACSSPASNGPSLDGDTTPPDWSVDGPGAADYRAAVDHEVKHAGPASGLLESVTTPVTAYGSLSQSFVADDYRGERVRLSAFLRTENVASWAGLWMRVDRPHGRSEFDNMQDRGIHGTTGWARYDVVLDVPADAASIHLGAMVDGEGKIWMDDVRLEVVPPRTPVTSIDRRPRTLQNAGLEVGDPPASWFLSGGARAEFVVNADRSIRHGGVASARLRSASGKPSGYGTLMQSFRADDYRGQRLRMTSFVKGEGVSGRGDFWVRVQAIDSRSDGGGLSHGDCNLAGTFDWQPCEVVFEVPPAGDSIQLGAGLGGPGTLWLDDVTLEAVGQDVPLSIASAPRTLQNGGLDAGDPPAGWFLSGSAGQRAELHADTAIKHGGTASARLERKADELAGYATLMQGFGATDYRGQRLRMTSWVKGAGITGRGDFWLRVQAVDSPGDGTGLGGGHCMLSQTFDWKLCEIVFDVPEAGSAIELGGGLGGPGTLWIDDVQIQTVGPDVPLTRRGGEALARTLRNGDFESSKPLDGWYTSGGARDEFAAQVDATTRHGGNASARLQPLVASPSGYGTLMQGFDATDYLGKRVRVATFVKGDGISERAEFWARVQAIDSPGDGRGIAGGRCALRRTFDWQRCEIAGHHIQVGAGLRGPGTLWMDDVRVEVVGEEVAVTSPPPPRAPQNLGFDR